MSFWWAGGGRFSGQGRGEARRSAARGGWSLGNYQNAFQEANLHSDTPLPCGHGGGYVETSTTTDILGGLKGLRTALAWRGEDISGAGGSAIFFSGEFGSQAVFGPSRGHGRVWLEKSVRRDTGRAPTEA